MKWTSILAATATVLIGTILTLNVCVVACSVVTVSDTASNDAASSCPKHHPNSDCCKHPSSDSELARWTVTVAAMCPVTDLVHSVPVLLPSHKEVFARVDIADSSGGLPALVASRLRI